MRVFTFLLFVSGIMSYTMQTQLRVLQGNTVLMTGNGAVTSSSYDLVPDTISDDDHRNAPGYRTAKSGYFFERKGTESPEEEIHALISRARMYRSLKNDSAFYFSDMAFKLIEDRRSRLLDETLKAAVFAGYATFYNEVGSWYAHDEESYEKTFELFERSKARSLMDDLLHKEPPNTARTSEHWPVILQIRQKAGRLHNLKGTETDPGRSAELDQKISRLEIQHEALLEEIRQNNTAGAGSQGVYFEVISLNEIQQRCDKNTAVIEYAFTYNGLSILVITRNSVYFTEYRATENIRDQIEAGIKAFRKSLTEVESEEKIRNYAEPLYEKLIAPVSDHLEGIDKLIIVPDRSLALLPFDALTDQNGQYLVHRYAIKVMPSASMFKLLPDPHRESKIELLAFAGSGFEDDKGMVGSQVKPAFKTIPYTLIEVNSIAAGFERSLILRNEQATETALKELPLTDYKYIHFATHAALNEVYPSKSGLILSRSSLADNPINDDGYLSAHEVSELMLNADLVVLSSCNTATGKIVNGEGLLGLQRAFLTAGASSVVATLWSIYDRSTPLFMTHFYQNMAIYRQKERSIVNRLKRWTGRNEPELVGCKTLALRDAKLKMLQHPYYKHPVHWASFVITGK